MKVKPLSVYNDYIGGKIVTFDMSLLADCVAQPVWHSLFGTGYVSDIHNVVLGLKNLILRHERFMDICHSQDQYQGA